MKNTCQCCGRQDACEQTARDKAGNAIQICQWCYKQLLEPIPNAGPEPKAHGKNWKNKARRGKHRGDWV